MRNSMKRFLIIAAAAVIGFSMVSCMFFKEKSDKNSKTRELAGVQYTIISPKEYAQKIKAGEIGVKERYVIDGLFLGSTDNDLMIQQAGLTNIFSFDKPIELNMGTKIRVYIEITMVNTVLISASQAAIKKLEKF